MNAYQRKQAQEEALRRYAGLRGTFPVQLAKGYETRFWACMDMMKEPDTAKLLEKLFVEMESNSTIKGNTNAAPDAGGQLKKMCIAARDFVNRHNQDNGGESSTETWRTFFALEKVLRDTEDILRTW